MSVPVKADVIIVGAGLAGLSCGRSLMHAGVPFLILEADGRTGGRVKTESREGFLLNRGFQVLQTAYPEARRQLDFNRLDLKPFIAGAMVRIGERFFRVADPRRHPREMVSTLRAPIGTFGDRLRILRLTMRLLQTSDTDIFRAPDTTTADYLRAEGFSEKIIERLFRPFFAGVCLDPEISASSRVFRYIFKVFAEGDVALPVRGMGAIAEQLAEAFPDGCIRTGSRVQTLEADGVVLESGQRIRARAVVLATEGPEAARLLGLPKMLDSRGELCLYFAAKEPPIAEPYLVLNGNGTGWVNSLTVPSLVAPSYAPAGQALVSVVVIGHMSADDATAESIVRRELSEWFGKRVGEWRHLKTDRIVHALPFQPPPMTNPTLPTGQVKRGLYVCGEHGSVPGIQWALLSGRLAAEQVLKGLAPNLSE